MGGAGGAETDTVLRKVQCGLPLAAAGPRKPRMKLDV